MKTTKQLIQEHDSVLIMLSILDKIVLRLRAGEAVNPIHISGVIHFLKVFVDQCHHGKEEQLLFPLLERKGIANNGGPVGVMLSEHVQGRAFIKGMSDANDIYLNGDLSAVNDIVRNASGYMELLHSHISKENNVLFKLADSRITEKEDAELFNKFLLIDNEEIGSNKMNELQDILVELQNMYIVDNVQQKK